MKKIDYLVLMVLFSGLLFATVHSPAWKFMLVGWVASLVGNLLTNRN